MQTPSARRRVLFASNGHGEDSIAGTVIDHLRLQTADHIDVHAWPMVGLGRAYAARGVPLRGAQNLLPSEGFAMLDAKMMWRDIRAGWIGTHLRQLSSARTLRGEYDLVVAVGDIVPVIAATIIGAPFVFIGCAKSHYYAQKYWYQPYEIPLLRKATLAFARDARTANFLASKGVPAVHAGNPMMDELNPTGESFGIPSDAFVVVCLPGSRSGAERNAERILDVCAALGARLSDHVPMYCVFAVTHGFDAAAVARRLGAQGDWVSDVPCPDDLERGVLLRARLGESNRGVVFVFGRLADALARAQVVIGLAGTANEQAAGLGKPLVTFPTDGVQGRAYQRMKMTYFGDAACVIPDDPPAAADEIVRLLRDEERLARMAGAGRERMGEPGCSAVIARAAAELAR